MVTAAMASRRAMLVMGVGTGVDQQTGDAVASRGMNPVDQYPLVIGLEALHLHTQFTSQTGPIPVDIGQGGVPVNLRLATAEQVQLGPCRIRMRIGSGRARPADCRFRG